MFSIKTLNLTSKISLTPQSLLNDVKMIDKFNFQNIFDSTESFE